MEEIKKDLDGWNPHFYRISGHNVLIINFVHSAEKSVRDVRKIVGDRAEVKAVKVGSCNFILISK